MKGQCGQCGTYNKNNEFCSGCGILLCNSFKIELV